MKNVVLCGSMKVKDQILKVADELKSLGYEALLPVECMEGRPKEIASRAHFGRIVDARNQFILIVNATKNGIENYIGPNSFAEIAFGFYHDKEVFVLNDFYEPYRDELEGWGAVALHGDLSKLNDFEYKDEPDILRLATQIFLNANAISTALLQRKMHIGFGRAAAIIDELEDMGIISEPRKVGNRLKREILISSIEEYDNPAKL